MPRKKQSIKRGNGEGSIYKKPNGTWMSQITIGKDENGKSVRKAFSGKTRAEVAAKMAPFLAEESKERIIIQKEMPLQKHMLFWLMNYKKFTVTGRTFETYMRHFKNHICPNLGSYLPQDVTKNHIQMFLGGMLNNGYCLDTVKKNKNLLSQYFEYCLDENIVTRNPVSKIVLQSKERKTYNEEEARNLEEREYKAIPEELRDKVYEVISKNAFFKALCLTCMLAGLRIGEALALKWKDFNAEKQSLSVLRAATIEPTFDNEGNVIKHETVIGQTKTAGSERILPIGKLLTDVLTEWQKLRIMQEYLTGAPLSKPNDYIFANNAGNLRTYYGTHALFDRLLKKNGLGDKGLHFYSFRHTFSNTLFENQKNPKVIQILMGHSKVETTMKYNTATTTTFLQDAANVFDERYTQYEKDSNDSSDGEIPQTATEKTPITPQLKDSVSKKGIDVIEKMKDIMDIYGFETIDEVLSFLSGEKSSPENEM